MLRRIAGLAVLVFAFTACVRPSNSVPGSRSGPYRNTSIPTATALKIEPVEKPAAVINQSSPTNSIPVTTSMGQPVPTPIGGPSKAPPPAWLLIDNQAIPASYGSTNLMEAPPPELMDQIATVQSTRKVTSTIVIGAEPIAEFWAGVRPWGNDTAQFDRLNAQPVSNQTNAFSIAPIAGANEQVLLVFVRFAFENGGDATYVWKLSSTE